MNARGGADPPGQGRERRIFPSQLLLAFGRIFPSPQLLIAFGGFFLPPSRMVREMRFVPGTRALTEVPSTFCNSFFCTSRMPRDREIFLATRGLTRYLRIWDSQEQKSSWSLGRDASLHLFRRWLSPLHEEFCSWESQIRRYLRQAPGG